MSQGYAYGKAGVSGQRSGQDRRRRASSPPDGEERRFGQDRREQWSPLNEWTSTLNRQAVSKGETGSSK